MSNPVQSYTLYNNTNTGLIIYPAVVKASDMSVWVSQNSVGIGSTGSVSLSSKNPDGPGLTEGEVWYPGCKKEDPNNHDTTWDGNATMTYDSNSKTANCSFHYSPDTNYITLDSIN